MALSYTQITGTFEDGQGNPLTGTAEFSVNVPLYASGVPVVIPDVPVQAQIVSGQLQNSSGGNLQLLDLASTGLVIEGSQTGFWYWSAEITVGGVVSPSWGFFLEHSSAPTDLYSLANTPPSGGGVDSVFGRTGVVTAQSGDYSVSEVTGAAPLASPTFTGTPTAPTASPLTDGTQLATTAYADAAVGVEASRAQAAEALRAPLASPALTGSPTAPTQTTGDNSTRIATTAFVEAAVPAALPPNGSAGGDLSGSYPSPAVAKVNGVAVTGTPSAGQYPRASGGTAAAWGPIQAADVPTLNQATTGNAATATNLAGGATLPAYLAPHVVPLTDGAPIAVNAALGNDFQVTIAGNRTMAAPGNPVNGQCITFAITQDGTGSRTVTWTSGAGGYSFGSGSAPTLSTAANATDLVAFRYSSAAGPGAGAWCGLGSALGF